MGRVPLLVAFFSCLAFGSLASGCRCGGGGVGEECAGNDDCDPGLFCDPLLLVCAAIGTDGGMPGVDGGGPSDGATDSGPVCLDADGDSFTDCAGDCDDGDPLTYPGAPEVCGDGVTNDCSSSAAPDTGCMGIGTYVAPPPVGSPGGAGTQADPVDTIAQGLLNAVTIGTGVDVYVAADVAGPGVYAEDIVMIDGISILGGHESTTWTRDPAVNVTVIDDQTAVGVDIPASVTAGTALDGFTVNGAPGLGGVVAAITVAGGASPDLTSNVINAPNTMGRSIGIDVNPGNLPSAGTPLITGNVINLGASLGGWGVTTGSYGILLRSTAATVARNAITLADDDTFQFGITAGPGSPSAGLLIAFNVVRGSPAGSSDIGIGINVGGGFATVDSNDVAVGSCSNTCEGVLVGGNALVVTITNNVIFGGVGPISRGLSIQFEGVPAVLPDVLVHSNYINGVGSPLSGGSGISLSAGIWLGEHPTSLINAGRFYDNIVSSGVGATRYALYEQDENIQPDIFDHNAIWMEPTPAPLATTPPSGLYLDQDISMATTWITAAEVDALGFGTGNLEDACMVTSPIVGGDFHLLPGSICIDAGNATELPLLDFEGDTRPAGSGPDIGVDET